MTGYTGFSSDPTLQEGNYLAVNFADNDFSNLTSVKIGLRPTYKSGSLVDDDSGLVEAINDPDKNGVFRIVDESTQKLKIVTTDGVSTHTQVFDLSGLTLQS